MQRSDGGAGLGAVHGIGRDELPGPIVEFEKVIGPLVEPEAYGGDAADAFHMVAPSLPRYAFSEAPREPGWNVNRIARTFASLMPGSATTATPRRAATGARWSPARSRWSIPRMVRPSHSDPTDLRDDDRARLEEIEEFDREHSAYFALRATRPQTLPGR